MRMRAFKSHGMNRVIAKSVSHAVNDMYRNSNKNKSHNRNYSNSNVNNSNNVNSEITGDGAIAIFTIFVVFVLCLVFPKLFFVLFFIGLGIWSPITLFIGIPLIFAVIGA